jgi:hypothetical protein
MENIGIPGHSQRSVQSSRKRNRALSTILKGIYAATPANRPKAENRHWEFLLAGISSYE